MKINKVFFSFPRASNGILTVTGLSYQWWGDIVNG